MNTPDNWRKSSYSGSGDGNACVEIANRQAHMAVRDSKNPAHGTLAFPTAAFSTFLTALKSTSLQNVAQKTRCQQHTG
ncbi:MULTISPECIES: DUF397 domain-containing protein [Streptomyces]|uniref:DUF397 domain-containing protein n=1 Tax=Streptomyces sviceus (strain ATCC 29083 / DSM 924 / JCM 4929 / NBRC 13980 / NCIMB 11184 / NRRL 5439 / UC 5370) TaxID=463191 RepID=B5HWZ5_STRX2|nr:MULTISPECIES: DUF397 domain-containing protein [Streptomyces]EDY57350.1 conserved hypothetical protein [Streptomyces sviceus ATCC 29083]MYT06352.1 DUF397 domain-containing protein [Streptomyces sp. SID5470]